MIVISEIFFDVETTGLVSADCRITCIGLLHNDLGVRVFSSKNESVLLLDFFEFVESHCTLDDIWVSFNGVGFDVPFICARAVENGLVLPNVFSRLELDDGVKFELVNHVDLMLVVYPQYKRIVGGTSTGRVTKSGVLNFFHVYEPSVGSAQNCLLVAESLDWSAIWLHNAADLFSTKKIFDECRLRGWC